ncbi:MAG: M20 family metallopeptidase [Methylococcales bacterium]|nr:M20 family metallopeptidase [Methylococcales bacterium]
MANHASSLIAEITAGIGEIRAIRHDLHAHPELCFEERRTADLVAEKLTEWGIPLHRGLGKTGVVGMIKAGDADKAIGLRADMDALPMQENNQFRHASTYPGKMHACGHDGHTAMLLAAGRYLAEHRDFDGTVYLIFQPAEENGGGASVMMEDGLFRLFPMQAVYGMHNCPGLAAGRFALSAGPVMAAFSAFRIVITGLGCHAAMPHLGLDPAPVAAQLILAFQTIITRNLHPLENAVISVTTVHVGETGNVIADSCELGGTVRTFSGEAQKLIERRMRELSEHICLAHGMSCHFEFSANYPATVNHAGQVAIARKAMTELVGAENVEPQQPTMGAEDFAFMLQSLPGCYCFIGNGDGDHRSGGHGAGPCTLHNGSYDFNDDILALGAAYWVKLVAECLPIDNT